MTDPDTPVGGKSISRFSQNPQFLLAPPPYSGYPLSNSPQLKMLSQLSRATVSLELPPDTISLAAVPSVDRGTGLTDSKRATSAVVAVARAARGNAIQSRCFIAPTISRRGKHEVFLFIIPLCELITSHRLPRDYVSSFLLQRNKIVCSARACVTSIMECLVPHSIRTISSLCGCRGSKRWRPVTIL